MAYYLKQILIKTKQTREKGRWYSGNTLFALGSVHLVWPACLRLAFSFVTRGSHLSYVEDHDLWRVSDSLKPELLTQGKLSELK